MQIVPTLAIGALVALLSQDGARGTPDRRECRYVPPAEWLGELSQAVRAGRLADPRERPLPALPAAPVSAVVDGGGPEPCFGPAHVHAYEDTAQVILTASGIPELIDLMVEGANDLLSRYGDGFDFVGFLANSDPNTTLGPFYVAVKNDVSGIGDPSGMGTPLFDLHASFGLAGSRIQGLFLIADVNVLEPGAGPAADLTRLILNHELEHRFAMFLPDLADGRRLQGDLAGCGRPAHWSWKVDGQGSCMEISEWTGAFPAVFASLQVFRNESFNTDTGGVFSYPDLYLMGYVTAAEMDAGVSELRYMETAPCTTTPYGGAISTFSSSEVVAAAGPRVPGAASAQKHFRTAWVMLHQPGDPPDQDELERAVGVIRQQRTDWYEGTLGRGSMSHRLFDCGKIRRGPVVPLDGEPRTR